jgi:hypothetical protein
MDNQKLRADGTSHINVWQLRVAIFEEAVQRGK